MTLEWAALVIGINYYPFISHLTAPVEDAEKIAEQLKQYGYRTFRIQRLPETYNPTKGDAEFNPQGEVTSKQLKEAIVNLLNPPPPNPIPETALLFFSGHGLDQNVNGKKEVFLATSDVIPDDDRTYDISLSWLGQQLQESQVKQVIVWLDCCYSGELMSYIPPDKNYCLITAARSYETAIEIPYNQGLLTKQILEGLNPKRVPDGIITSHNLADFIQKQMKQTRQLPLIKNSDRTIQLTTKSPIKSFQNKCPYRALAYFSEKKEDADVFYGREELTKKLIEKVRNQQRLIAVLGSSGSGKSSLLRAGLLYRLKLGQEIPGSDRWIYIPPFTPKETPLESLWAAFSQQSFSDFKKTSVNISHLLVEKFSEKARNTPIILIIDQFEECFTMCSKKQREVFFNCLQKMVDDIEKLCILIGMRSDFRVRLREYPQLDEKINKPFFTVEKLNSHGIKEAITKPANFVGLGIEGELIQQLINDVEGYPGSLPLLQYTLTELWKSKTLNQSEPFLRLETYKELGGIERSLQKRADEIYNNNNLFTEKEKIVVRRIFLELTQIGETTDIRRRVRLKDLENSHHSIELLQQVSDKLASADTRLITKLEDERNPQDVILDVVHEALLRHWTQLNNWKEEYQDAIVTERKIEALAQEWHDNGRKSDYLLPEKRLGWAEVYLEKYDKLEMLDGVAEEYIKESKEECDRQRQEEEERRQQELKTLEEIAQASKARLQAEEEARKQADKKTRVTIFASVFVLGLAILAGYQWRNAQEKTINALAETSKASLLSNRQLEALVIAVQSVKQLQTPILFQDYAASQHAYEALRQAFYNVQERNSLEKDTSPVYSVAFRPDSKTLAFVSAGNSITLWDLATHKITTLHEHRDAVLSVAFSPDGKTLASGSDDKSIKLWDVTTHKEIKTLNGHSDAVYSVAFSPDGKTLASASYDKTIKLWDVNTGKEIKTLNGHKDAVLSVAFSPDGKTLASASYDNTIKLWDLATRKQIATLEGGAKVLSVAFSPDGKTLASGNYDKSIKLWDLATREQITTLYGHSDTVLSVAFSPDGKTLASGSYDKSTKLWDLATRKFATLYGHSDTFLSVAFSRSGKTLASGSDDKSIKLWDVTTGKQIATLYGHSLPVNSVAFSRSGKTLASGSDDKSIKLWDLATRKFATLYGHGDAVLGVAFSLDGKTLASGSADNSIKLWDVVTHKEITTLHGHTDTVLSVAFSPDGKTLASGSVDHSIKLWDVVTHKEIATLEGGAVVWSVVFSSDGKTLASGSDDKSIKLWDVATREQITNLYGHSDKVLSVAFSPDGKTLASGSADHSIKLWKPNLDFDPTNLTNSSCEWLHDYLQTKPSNVTDPHLCDGIGTQR